MCTWNSSGRLFLKMIYLLHTPKTRQKRNFDIIERLKMLLRLLSLARTFSSSSLVGMLEIGKAICDSLKNIFLFSFLRFAKKEVIQQNNKSRRQISSVESFSCPRRIDGMNTRRQLIEFPPREKNLPKLLWFLSWIELMPEGNLDYSSNIRMSQLLSSPHFYHKDSHEFIIKWIITLVFRTVVSTCGSCLNIFIVAPHKHTRPSDGFINYKIYHED